MNEEIYKKLLKKQFVVVAGAGISMLPPSSLPSWWEFNNILKETIYKKAFGVLPKMENQLGEVLKKVEIPVTAFSDIIVSSVAGNSYFELLKLLEGNKPNANHYALVELVKNQNLLSIITTNFDTLIEQAFRNELTSITVFSSNDDFATHESSYPSILKVHGSVTNKDTFIDTITQKFKGLTNYKKFHVSNITSKYPIVFIGFSGSDYIFEKNYIPIDGDNNEPIYWIVRKGSKLTEEALEALNNTGRTHIIIEENLPDFFEKLNIEIKKDIKVTNEEIDYSYIEGEVNKFFDEPHITGWGCIAIIYDILYKISNVEAIDLLTNLIIEELTKSNLELNISQRVILLKLATSSMLEKKYNSALYFLNANINISDEILKNNNSKESIIEIKNNLSTIYNNIGLCYIEKKEYNEGFKAFDESIQLCNETSNLKNLVISKFNKSRFEYEFNSKDYDKFINELKIIIKEANNSGNIQIAFESSVELFEIYLNIYEFNNAKKMIPLLKNLSDISSSVQNEYQLFELKAKLYSVNNKPKECYDILNEAIEKFQDNEIIKRNLYQKFIAYLSFYKNYHAEIIEYSKLVFNERETSYIKENLDNSSPPFISLLNNNLSDCLERNAREDIVEKLFYGDKEEVENSFRLLLKEYITSENKLSRFLDVCNEFESITAISDIAKIEILSYKIGYYSTFNDFPQALKLCDEALKIKTIDNNLRLKILFQKSKISLKLDVNIEHFYDYFKIVLDNKKQDKIIINSTMEIYDLIFKEINSTKATEVLEKIVELLSNSKYSDLSKTIYNLQFTYRGNYKTLEPDETAQAYELSTFAQKEIEEKKFENAKKYLNKALIKYKQSNDLDGESVCYNDFASMYSEESDFNNAIDYSKKALKLKQKQNNTHGEIVTLSNLSSYYFHNKDYINSISCGEKVLKLSQGKEIYKEIFITKYFLSLSLFNNNRIIDFINMIKVLKDDFAHNFDQSLNHLREAVDSLYQDSLKMINSIQNIEIKAINEFDRFIIEASRLQRKGKYLECEILLNKLSEKEHLTEFKKAQIEGTYGYLYLAQSLNNKAKESFNYAFKIFKKYNAKTYQIEVMRNLAVIERNVKNFKSAIEICEKILELDEKNFQVKFDLAQIKYHYCVNIDDFKKDEIDEIINLLNSISIDKNDLLMGSVNFLMAQIHHDPEDIDFREEYLSEAKRVYIFNNSIFLDKINEFENLIKL